MKIMKKILFNILVLFFLTSCNERTKTTIDINNYRLEPYKVVKIIPYDSDKSLSKYYLFDGENSGFYLNETSVVDTTGKYMIGDSIYFHISKKLK